MSDGSDHLRTWASEQLGLSDQASSQQSRSTMFQRLDSADFSPPESWFPALGVLDPSISPLPDFSEDVEKEIRNTQLRKGQIEIDDFATLYWETLPRARRAQWQRLRDCYSAFGPLFTRLGHLECGLGLKIGPNLFEVKEAQGVLEQSIKMLLENIVEWYPLPPAIQASRRREWLLNIPRNQLWAYAASYLTEHHPQVAALDPELVAFLVANPQRIQQIKASTKARKKLLKTANRESSSNSSGSGWSWQTILIVFGILGVLRSCAKDPVSKRSDVPAPYSYSRPESQYHPFKTKDEQKTDSSFPMKSRLNWVRFPDRFHRDGSPKTIELIPGQNLPGEVEWRNAGGKYKHELPSDGALLP